MLCLELCLTSSALGLRAPSRRAGLCSGGPRPLQETGPETSTPTISLGQGLKAPGWAETRPLGPWQEMVRVGVPGEAGPSDGGL